MEKRLLSIFLLISILLSSFNFVVYAANPGVKTIEPDDIETTSAVLKGCVTSNSGIRIKEYGFKFVNDGNVSIKKFVSGKDFEYPDPINNDVIEYKKTKLKAGKKYYYQFYAINENGEQSFGKTIDFETKTGSSSNSSSSSTDTKKPCIDDFDCTEGYTFEEGTYVKFYAKASDNDKVDTMWLYIDGKEVKKKSGESISYSTDDLKAGTHTISVKVTDVSGNKKEESMTVTVVGKKDTTKPMINPIKSSAGNSIEEGTGTKFSTRALDNALHSVAMYIDGELAAETLNDTIEYSTKSLSVGTHIIKVVARDKSGNENETSISITVTQKTAQKEEVKQEKDTTKPMINPIKSSAGNSIEEGTKTTFSTRASDNALYAIYMYIDGKQVKSVKTDTIEYSTSSLSAGTHIIKVIAEDETGNENETSISVTVTKKENLEEVNHNEVQEEVNHDEVQEEINQNEIPASVNNDVLVIAVGEVQGYFNGDVVSVENPPYIDNGRTLIPLRFIAEKLGANVDWDADTKVITISNDDSVATYKIGNKNFTIKGTYYQNGEVLYSEYGITFEDTAAPIIKGMRTFIPLRLMCEKMFNKYVHYIDDGKIIVICSKDGLQDNYIYSNMISKVRHSHSYLSNGNGTHTCSVCNKTVNCSGNPCSICGYTTQAEQTQNNESAIGISQSEKDQMKWYIENLTGGDYMKYTKYPFEEYNDYLGKAVYGEDLNNLGIWSAIRDVGMDSFEKIFNMAMGEDTITKEKYELALSDLLMEVTETEELEDVIKSRFSFKEDGNGVTFDGYAYNEALVELFKKLKKETNALEKKIKDSHVEEYLDSGLDLYATTFYKYSENAQYLDVLKKIMYNLADLESDASGAEAIRNAMDNVMEKYHNQVSSKLTILGDNITEQVKGAIKDGVVKELPEKIGTFFGNVAKGLDIAFFAKDMALKISGDGAKIDSKVELQFMYNIALHLQNEFFVQGRKCLSDNIISDSEFRQMNLIFDLYRAAQKLNCKNAGIKFYHERYSNAHMINAYINDAINERQ